MGEGTHDVRSRVDTLNSWIRLTLCVEYRRWVGSRLKRHKQGHEAGKIHACTGRKAGIRNPRAPLCIRSSVHTGQAAVGTPVLH